MVNRTELVNLLQNFFREKANHFHLEMAFLYGSHAGGFPKEASDIDVAVVFQADVLSDEKRLDLITGISVSLSVKLARDVNVLPIYDDFRSPMLYYNAIVHGIPVFMKDRNRYIALKLEAIGQMEDFTIWGTRWQLTISRKNIEALKHG